MGAAVAVISTFAISIPASLIFIDRKLRAP
jgi:hypothetical protein